MLLTTVPGDHGSLLNLGYIAASELIFLNSTTSNSTKLEHSIDMSESEIRHWQLAALAKASAKGNVNAAKVLLDKAVPIDSKLDEDGGTADCFNILCKQIWTYKCRQDSPRQRCSS